jgi:surface protein
MSYMLHATTVFNQNIGGWDVSKVTDMSYMLSSASAFNQDIAFCASLA